MCSAVSGKTRFLSSQPPPLPGAWCDIDVPFRAENFAGSCSLHIDQLWDSVLISIYCRKKLSDQSGEAHRCHSGTDVGSNQSLSDWI